MEFHLYVKYHVLSFDPVGDEINHIHQEKFNYINNSLQDIKITLDNMGYASFNDMYDILKDLNHKLESIAKLNILSSQDDELVTRKTPILVQQNTKPNTLIYDEKNHCDYPKKYKQFVMMGTNKGGTMEVNELLNKYCYHDRNDIPISVLGDDPFRSPQGNGHYQKMKNIYDNNQLILHVIKHPITWMYDVCQFIIKQNISMYHKLYEGRDHVKETTFIRIDASSMTNKECQSKMLDNKYYVTFNFDDNFPSRNTSRIISYYARSASRLQEMNWLINTNISTNFEYRVNYIFVRYEDLITKGSPLINELCDCIDGYKSKPEINVMSMLNHRTNVDHSQYMTSDEYQLFQYYLGMAKPQLTALGYAFPKHLPYH